jgi:hypothetical protein
MSPFWKKDKYKNKSIAKEVLTFEDVSELQRKEEKEMRLRGAEYEERCGRYKVSADIYQQIATDFGDKGFNDKIIELRNRGRDSKLKIISVDVNELIKQLKESGGVIAYRCPTCSADLKVNGDTKSLGKCEYCGSKIDNLPDVLKAILH